VEKIEALRKVRLLLYEADELLYNRAQIFIHHDLEWMMIEHRVNLTKLVEYINMHSWMDDKYSTIL